MVVCWPCVRLPTDDHRIADSRWPERRLLTDGFGKSPTVGAIVLYTKKRPDLPGEERKASLTLEEMPKDNN